jgi:CDP-diacylglycerol--serine O-phosphatidyltransferase
MSEIPSQKAPAVKVARILLKRRFKQIIEKNRWLKSVPNALTICNSLCGFGAILYTLRVYDPNQIPENVLAVSAGIILCAMIFDALDGFAARIFNAASMHGVQMDSLADMVTFGIAPAVVVSVMAHKLRPGIFPEMQSYQYYFIWAVCATYIGCAASRLATYNVHAILEKKSGDKFAGLPSPGAAAAICGLVIYYSAHSGEHMRIVTYIPIYAAVLGLLMVSKIKYQHAGKWLQSLRRNRNRMILAIACLIFGAVNFKLALFVLTAAYVASGLLNEIYTFFFGKKEDSQIQPKTA